MDEKLNKIDFIIHKELNNSFDTKTEDSLYHIICLELDNQLRSELYYELDNELYNELDDELF